MGGIRIFLIALLAFLSTGILSAQNRYAVFYKYKPQESFSLSNPGEFLTQKALSRRAKEGVAIDSLDLPVSEKYIAEVEALSEYIVYNSKWYNASIAVLSDQAVKEVEGFDFVESIEYIAPGFRQNPNARLRQRLSASVSLTSCSDENKRVLNEDEKPYDFQNEMLGIPLMHKEGFRGDGITIAVFDAGFPSVNTVPAFANLFDNGQLIANRDFVRPWMADVFMDNQHGTNVLSLLAADDPDLLEAGAPDSDYILVITEDDDTEYRVEEYTWVRGAEYADSLGADIIHSSVGYFDFDDPTMNYTSADMDGVTTVIARGAKIASDKGILVVNSSGNYGSAPTSLMSPADVEEVLAVGGVNANLEVTNSSSRGPTADGRIKPDLAALSSGVALIRSNGTLGFASGTSFSSPQVTALAAGLMQAKPEWKREELIDNLKNSASQADDPDDLLGFGIPNFYLAYFGEILSSEDPIEEPVWKAYPNPIDGDILSILVGNQLSTEVALMDMSGREVLKGTLQRNSIKSPYELSLRNVPPGLYILQAIDGLQPRQMKIHRK